MGFSRSLVLQSLLHAAVDPLLELMECLHFIHTVDQIGDHSPNFLFFFRKGRERSVGSVELITAVKVSLVFVVLDVEQCFRVLG